MALDKELELLPEQYRTPILLHYIEGRTQVECAEILQCPYGTLSGRLNRARELLRLRMERQGITRSPAILTAVMTEFANDATLQSLELLVNPVVAMTGSSGVGCAVSANVAALAKGALKMMFLAKLKAIAVVTVVIFSAGTVAISVRAHSKESDPPGNDSRDRHQEAPASAELVTMYLSALCEAQYIHKRSGEYAPTIAVLSAKPGMVDAHVQAADATLKEPKPLKGYLFLVMTKQGSSATGGEKNYFDNAGKLTGGFAVAAIPAVPIKGAACYLMASDKEAYQMRLGDDAAAQVQGIDSFDPKPGKWTGIDHPWKKK